MTPIAHTILHAIFPTRCCGCDELLQPHDKVLCGVCRDLITPLTDPLCPICGSPFASPYALSESPAHLCGQCRESAPPFDGAASGCEFGGPFRDLLHTFKFNQRPDLAPFIARLMLDTLQFPDADLIVAVPLHPKRLRARGYNQSLLLAMEISRASGAALSIDDLARTRATRTQTDLHHDEREENVRGAFRVTQPEAVAKRSVLLVDDIYTTGSTVRECAKVLKKAGAASVFVVTAARVVL